MFENVMTLVATPPHPPLEVQQIQQAAESLRALGAQVGAPVWLAPAQAVDLPFSGLLPAQAALAAETMLADTLVDVIAQPSAGRRKKLLIADMDSTMIEQECLDELADAVGLKAETAAITERAMRGELDFAAALHERVANLKGLNVAALEATKQRLTFMPGGRTLVQTMQAQGAPCYLVSGGFTFFTSYVAQALGFTAHRANQLLIEQGQLTGQVATPILDKNAKLAFLHEFAGAAGLTLSQTIAVGDGANDLPMLQAAGLGVAYHAKPKVNEQAAARVRHSNLTALLFAQGYPAADFRD